MTVAIQGELGSFSEAAAHRMTGVQARLLCCRTFDDLFAAVRDGRATRAVVPVHNTVVGDVLGNEQRIAAGGFRIVDALSLPVTQCLIARPGTAIETVHRVASHAVALRQCTHLFAAHPGWTPLPIDDTAGGVRDLVAGGLDADAVIASAEAARRYGGVVLLTGVADVAENFTDFLLIEAVVAT